MDQIRQQVARARRRLWMELFLNRLVHCWFVALIVAAVAIAVPKFVAVENLPADWTAWWLGAAFVGGLGVALGWMFFRGRSELDAGRPSCRPVLLWAPDAGITRCRPFAFDRERQRAGASVRLASLRRRHGALSALRAGPAVQERTRAARRLPELRP